MKLMSPILVYHMKTSHDIKGKSFSVDDVSLEAPKTFADAKKVHSSILDKKVVYNPTLPKNRDEALQKIKEQLIKRLNSTLKLKLHWTCECLGVLVSYSAS